LNKNNNLLNLSLARKEMTLNQFISLNENLKQEIKEANNRVDILKKELEMKNTDLFKYIIIYNLNN
jgi:hypothetical protein